MKIINKKDFEIISRIINILTRGINQSPPFTFSERLREAEYMLKYKGEEEAFIKKSFNDEFFKK